MNGKGGGKIKSYMMPAFNFLVSEKLSAIVRGDGLKREGLLMTNLLE